MKNKRYKVQRYSYEWSGQKKNWWKRTTLTVLLVVAAGVAGWFAFDPIYNMVMGAKIFTPQSSQSQPPSSVTPESQTPAQSVPEQVGTPMAEGLPERCYYLPAQTVTNPALLDAALASVKAAGGDGVIFDLKNDTGMVLYKSALPEVAAYLVQSETPYDLGEVLGKIKGAGLTPVGRLFAFKDSAATSAAAMSEARVKYMNSNVSWLDNAKASGGKSWLNANSPLAREYILKLVGEATSMGVERLILDGAQFPTGLSLHLATFGGEPDRSAVLSAFIAEAAKLCARNGASLYPVIQLDAAAGINAIMYGNNPEKLAAAAGGAVVDLRPEQFGIGVTTETLTLTKPLQTPYETVTAALAAAEALLQQEGVQLAGMVQCYTSQAVDAAANLTYGKPEVEAQVKAAGESGIEKIFYYSPTGTY